ncbi:MAG: ACP S-malonyltransferase [Gemmatimonadota bacterium]|nr:ACP S-malonyltransferase [Gemmatimonadota bacterium]
MSGNAAPGASRVVFQLPGQGSQRVGMGRALARERPEARVVFEEADDVLGFALSSLCWEGPEQELVRTENAQPALLACSVAAARVLEAEAVEPGAAAGHSLGEFSAHVVAGSLSLADALGLVRARGEAMAAAGREREGTMAAVLGLDAGAVEELCASARRDDEVLVPANFNAPGQVVVSGSTAAVRRAIESAKGHGARRALELNVSGAFHSPLMQPARKELAGALHEVDLRPARIPVVANVDARPVQEPDPVRERLLDQLTSPVRWVECVERLRELGATLFLEPGVGSVLTGLLRRIDRELEGRSVTEPKDLEGFAAP